MPPARIPTLSADDSLNARRVTCHQPLAGICVGSRGLVAGPLRGRSRPAALPFRLSVRPAGVVAGFGRRHLPVGSGPDRARRPGTERVGVGAADRRPGPCACAGPPGRPRPRRAPSRPAYRTSRGRAGRRRRSRGMAARTSGGGTRGSSGGCDGPGGDTRRERIAAAARLQPPTAQVMASHPHGGPAPADRSVQRAAAGTAAPRATRSGPAPGRARARRPWRPGRPPPSPAGAPQLAQHRRRDPLGAAGAGTARAAARSRGQHRRHRDAAHPAEPQLLAQRGRQHPARRPGHALRGARTGGPPARARTPRRPAPRTPARPSAAAPPARRAPRRAHRVEHACTSSGVSSRTPPRAGASTNCTHPSIRPWRCHDCPGGLLHRRRVSPPSTSTGCAPCAVSASAVGRTAPPAPATTTTLPGRRNPRR